jgi:hypothetical protein
MPGVHALPMVITQCNAVISLVDDKYYSRAWCSVEVLMIQTLCRTFGVHHWYEHVQSGEGDGQDIVREGPLDMHISMAEKALTFESDRPKILFLERQCKFLS